MRRWLPITLIAGGFALGVFVLGRQQATLASLRSEAADLRRAVALPTDSAEPPSIETSAQDQISSEAWHRLDEVIGEMGEVDSWHTAGTEVLPDVLRAAADLDSDQLTALASRLGSGRKETIVKALLEALAVEADPERFLTAQEEVSSHVYKTALAALARKDPAAARKVYEESQFGRYDKAKLGTVIGLQLFRASIAEGLAFFHSLPDETRHETMEGFTMLERDPATRAALYSAIGAEANESFQRDLSRSLVTATVRNDGFEAARKTLTELQLSATQRSRVLNEVTNEGLREDPEAMLGWISSATSPEERPDMMADAIRQWAERDYNAAGTWLGAQEASYDRDRAVSAFTSVIGRIDPEAAMVWTSEIQDQTEKQAARKTVLRQWAARDRESVKAWLEGQGWVVTEWIE